VSLDVLDGTWAWVWQERPETVRFCRGLIVRAANGEGTQNPQGFDFRENYRQWRAAFSGPLIAWTYLYANSDPVLAARALAQSEALAYIIDWEDAAGPAASGRNFQQCVDALRKMRPSVPVGFSSYPTRQQAEAHGVDWDAGLAVVDFVSPQMYYGYQIANYGQVIADAKGRYVQLDLEPAASDQWASAAQTHLQRGFGVACWRLGTLTAGQRQQLSVLQEATEMTQADIVAAVRDALNLHGDLAIPGGQVNNDRLAIILVEHLQGQENSLRDLTSAVADLGTAVAAANITLDRLAGGPGPAPAGNQVTGTFTGTIGPEVAL
jgi:hypothetical protein